MNKTEIKSMLKNVSSKTTLKSSNVFNKIKSKFIELWSGKGNFKRILYLWGVLPGVVVLVLQSKINAISITFISKAIYLLLSTYFIWHILVIRRTLKVQPELTVKKIKQKELFEGKTKEQISEIKKQIGKDRLKKALLLKAWDSAPNYVLVIAFDLLVALTQIQGLLN